MGVDKGRAFEPILGYVFFLFCFVWGGGEGGESKNGSVISDHSDHGASLEPTNPCPEWIREEIYHKSEYPFLDSPKKTHP